MADSFAKKLIKLQPHYSSGPLIRRCAFLTLFALQLKTQHGCPTFGSHHPWPVHPGRVVAHMLIVATRQLGNPVIFFVLVVTSYRLFHGSSLHERSTNACELR